MSTSLLVAIATGTAGIFLAQAAIRGRKPVRWKGNLPLSRVSLAAAATLALSVAGLAATWPTSGTYTRFLILPFAALVLSGWRDSLRSSTGDDLETDGAGDPIATLRRVRARVEGAFGDAPAGEIARALADRLEAAGHAVERLEEDAAGSRIQCVALGRRWWMSIRRIDEITCEVAVEAAPSGTDDRDTPNIPAFVEGLLRDDHRVFDVQWPARTLARNRALRFSLDRWLDRIVYLVPLVFILGTTFMFLFPSELGGRIVGSAIMGTLSLLILVPALTPGRRGASPHKPAGWRRVGLVMIRLALLAAGLGLAWAVIKTWIPVAARTP